MEEREGGGVTNKGREEWWRRNINSHELLEKEYMWSYTILSMPETNIIILKCTWYILQRKTTLPNLKIREREINKVEIFRDSLGKFVSLCFPMELNTKRGSYCAIEGGGGYHQIQFRKFPDTFLFHEPIRKQTLVNIKLQNFFNFAMKTIKAVLLGSLCSSLFCLGIVISLMFKHQKNKC